MYVFFKFDSWPEDNLVYFTFALTLAELTTFTYLTYCRFKGVH